MIELLDASKFGQKEYTPYEVYMKALFQYFRDELGEETPAPTRSAVEMAEFQEDAVKKARKILVQQLRTLLNSGGNEMLEALPDGIHSGLARADAKGVVFYFQAQESAGRKLHFWRYADLKNESILDNRYLVANLIASERDTPRVVDPEILGSIFDLQERVIEDILKSVQAQRAMEVAPRSTDPIQQTIATLLQNYLNHPDVNRREAIELIRTLNQPMFNVQLSALRKGYKAFQGHKDVKQLLSDLAELQPSTANANGTPDSSANLTPRNLRRNDLRLICVDVVSGG